MLLGYEYELANEIYRAHLHRADRARLQAMVHKKASMSIRKWVENVRNGVKRLHLFGGGEGNVKTHRVMR